MGGNRGRAFVRRKAIAVEVTLFAVAACSRSLRRGSVTWRTGCLYTPRMIGKKLFGGVRTNRPAFALSSAMSANCALERDSSSSDSLLPPSSWPSSGSAASIAGVKSSSSSLTSAISISSYKEVLFLRTSNFSCEKLESSCLGKSSMRLEAFRTSVFIDALPPASCRPSTRFSNKALFVFAA